ncbi:MAG: hypothetical protein LUD22_00060, partial [Coprobacillus sp.]|nr:hypothetical protein [Coprobacillus sp.]
ELVATKALEEILPEKSEEEELPTTYKLACLDSSNYCYRYFSGSTTGSTFLATTTDWNQAVDIYITAVDDSTENACTLSFTDANGNTKYIYKYVDNQGSANNTSVSINDEPSIWIWSGTNKGFIDQASNRYLCLYNSDSMRAYAQSNSNAPALPYTTQPEDPEKPELTETFEQVTSLTDGGVYYLGSYSDDTVHFITGQTSNYQLATTTDLTQAAAVTVTGNDADGWKLTLPNGNYIYMFLYNSSSLEFGTSSNATVPSSGVNVFSWNSNSATLYTTAVAKSSYQYSYFEYYNNLVQAYGASSLTGFNSAAHFYQQVTA